MCDARWRKETTADREPPKIGEGDGHVRDPALSP
jgi:hypothetical protein